MSNTHRIGRVGRYNGKDLQPGDLVDASAWPSRTVLEEGGWLIPIRPEAVVVPSATPAPGRFPARQAEPEPEPDEPEPPPALKPRLASSKEAPKSHKRGR